MSSLKIRPGPRNSITDVAGIRVGNADDDRAWTGATVVLADRPATIGIDVRGGAPGTRETDLADPACLVESADAVVLSGGSAFGLDAAGGVLQWLAEQGRGFPVGPARVPIVPAAILFDLLNGGDKGWAQNPEGSPYRALGRAAAAAAALEFAQGNAGAGLGAKAGRLKGGLGSASFVTESGLAVGAVMAVNPSGSVLVPGSRTFWAWHLAQGDEMGPQTPPSGPIDPAADLFPEPPAPNSALGAGANTTIGVVATNARLSKAEANRLAIMAQDGMARAIRPCHTPFDGDTLFVLATGAVALPEPRPAFLSLLGSMAADCVARAIARGVYLAKPLGPWPAYRG